jgi:hypothetical protein
MLQDGMGWTKDPILARRDFLLDRGIPPAKRIG